jgi:iron-sulfur cluster repair protein YtfE (RIC family)
MDADQVNRWQALVLDALKKMVAARMNIKLREQLARLHEESERVHNLHSGKHRRK